MVLSLPDLPVIVLISGYEHTCISVIFDYWRPRRAQQTRTPKPLRAVVMKDVDGDKRPDKLVY
jgi:hypothetical protein